MLEERTASVNPEITCSDGDDVASVHALDGFRLEVQFVDGTRGVVDLSALIGREDAGVFSALKDESLFRQAEVVYGAVTWPNGLDLAPDAMYEALRATGEWKI